ncbi:HlyD family efflux transporter periplasmic adaptor subunit [Arcicella aquatica]|uniref:HlyD family efflux transporter periplasmic adaptor subunit n=1 Tax=Arcicella aquatica TaxID=217141 RepID=A0ABU5QSQ6_9BACT|nr:HlyD family efflux transporter periplasmic adaptor subunit [Arcicella aquatica]MEA5259749.1 HlyD family efflux transporter periplasmic adaptor subunit [Arcicella aquatica]
MEINIKDIEPPIVYLNGSQPKKVDLPKPKLELRSEEVNEILSKRPALIIRYGLTIIAFLGILGIVASWYIKYPEVIKGSVMITTELPPLKVIPKVSGRLQKLLVNPNQLVRQGDFIAEIENTTRLENRPILQTLSQQLKSYLQNTSLKVAFPSNTFTFGDLQIEYNNLLKNYHESERLLGDAIYLQRKNILIQQITDYKKLVIINQRQVEINQEEFHNVEIKYAADKKLYQDKVYGKLEFLAFENTFLQKKKDNENYAKVLVENSLTLSERQKQLAELDFEYLQKTRTYRDNIQQSIQNIDNLLANWQQNYVITAPSDGALSFLKNLTENQMIRAGDTLFAVLPQKQTIVAFANVSAQNFGKVKLGQQAIIKLINYPFEEYGSLSGKIQEIESTPMGNQYRVKIKLPLGLKTNYDKTLPFRTEMVGSIEIITEDMRLLERTFYGFRKILNQR